MSFPETRWNMRLLTPLIFALFCFSAVTAAEGEPLTLKQAIVAVLATHPQLRISGVDRAIAATARQKSEGMLDPLLSGSLKASQEQVTPSSTFLPNKTTAGLLSATIAKPLASGDSVSVNLNYNRNDTQYGSPLISQLYNPSYNSQLNFSVRHPLFKGNGGTSYKESLAAADAGVEKSREQQRVEAHNLALQALNLFYQLLFDDVNIDIAKEAVARAKRLIRYQRLREQFGLTEKSDRLQAEALLATQQTNLQKARGQRLVDQSKLNRLMQQPADRSLTIVHQLPDLGVLPDVVQALQLAKRARPELKMLDAQMKSAEAQLRMARDEDQLQLDLVAELGSRKLAGNASRAAAGAFAFNDRYAALSLEFSDPLGRNSVRSAIRKAELSKQRVAATRLSTLEQIRDDLAAAMVAIKSGRPTLREAQRLVVAERKKFREELERYSQGRSDTATLVRFEGDLQNAIQSAKLQEFTIELAEMQLLWAEAQLMPKLGIDAASLVSAEDAP